MRTNLALVSTNPKHTYTYRETVALLPDDYRMLLAKDKSKHEETARALFIWTMKYGRHWLDTTTLMVFQFILWRTYTYYKQAELISKSQFLCGVWDAKSSESNCAPATSSTHTLYKALGILEELGFIRQTNIKINGADTISLFEIDCKTVLDHSRLREDDVSKLRESRKARGQVVDFPTESESFLVDKGWCTSAPRGVVQKCTTEGKPKTSKPKEEETKNTSCSVPRNETVVEIDCKRKVEEVIRKASDRASVLHHIKVQRAARGAAISLTDLNATWKQAMLAAYGTCTIAGLTAKEYGMFKRIVKTHELSCTWLEFFTWVIDNWVRINRESREFNDYKKKKSGDWSMKQEDTVFLGTDAPDLFKTVQNFGKLLKRYSQYSLGTKTAGRAEDTADVKQLKEELAVAKREASLSSKLLRQAMAAKTYKAAIGATPATRPRIVDPTKDTFFEEADSTLPRWK